MNTTLLLTPTQMAGLVNIPSQPTSGQQNLSPAAINPVIRICQDMYIKSVLGDELFLACQVGQETDPVPARIAALLPYIRTALTYYTYGAMHDDMGVQITPAGVQQFSSEFSSTADAIAMRNKSKFYTSAGANSVTIMINFLDENQDDYPEWQEKRGYKKNGNQTLNFA